MSKNVIFCADGTWNGPSEPDTDDKTAPATNVFKLFLNLEGAGTPGTFLLENEQERALSDANGDLRQIAKYLNGVGDSDNFLVKALGGTIGAGLITRIVRGYTFVSRNFAAGDKVFLAGPGGLDCREGPAGCDETGPRRQGKSLSARGGCLVCLPAGGAAGQP
jgi:uncharacterized protein (DUF2235 family)